MTERDPIPRERAKWISGSFEVAYHSKPQSGQIYRGLGLYRVMKGSPMGRRPPRWGLTHLNSGHRVCIINAHEAEAFSIGAEIAECADWDFDGLEGWKNREPQLKKKFLTAIGKHGKKISVYTGNQNETEARRIAINRAGSTT